MPNSKRVPKNGKAKLRVLLVDDHPIVRQGMAQLINQEPDFTVCGQAEDVHSAVAALETARPDIAIIDLSLKGVSGLELIKDFQVRAPKVPVLVLSMFDEALYAERALRAGARGYIMKQEAPEKVLGALRQILSGEIAVSGAMSSRMLKKIVAGEPADASMISALSDRELEVFQLIGQGLGTREIADRLFLSIKTIESYRAHIKDKLKLDTATQLVQYAVQWQQSTRVG